MLVHSIHSQNIVLIERVAEEQRCWWDGAPALRLGSGTGACKLSLVGHLALVTLLYQCQPLTVWLFACL